MSCRKLRYRLSRSEDWYPTGANSAGPGYFSFLSLNWRYPDVNSLLLPSHRSISTLCPLIPAALASRTFLLIPSCPLIVPHFDTVSVKNCSGNSARWRIFQVFHNASVLFSCKAYIADKTDSWSRFILIKMNKLSTIKLHFQLIWDSSLREKSEKSTNTRDWIWDDQYRCMV